MDSRNELVDEAISSVMRAIGGAFDELWQRPDVVELLDGFLAERVTLVIDRGGITIVERDTPPG